jgi:hypothetical protein
MFTKILIYFYEKEIQFLNCLENVVSWKTIKISGHISVMSVLQTVRLFSQIIVPELEYPASLV